MDGPAQDGCAQAPLLDRVIADGHALLAISDHTSFVMQWDRHWRPETYEMLRREFGLSAALDFADAMDSLLRETGRQDPRAWRVFPFPEVGESGLETSRVKPRSRSCRRSPALGATSTTD